MSSFLLVISATVAKLAYALDSCDSGYFTGEYDATYTNYTCVYKCYDSDTATYTSYDVGTVAFSIIQSECPNIQTAIDHYGPETCSTVNDLVFDDDCGCAYCACTEAIGTINIIEQQDVFTKTCTSCECTTLNNKNEIGWTCNTLYSLSNPQEWSAFTCTDPVVVCDDPYSSADDTRTPGDGWIGNYVSCDTFCYCNYNGTTHCETSYENILNSTNTALTAAFWSQCEDYAAGCQHSPTLLADVSISQCVCPRCRCGDNVTLGDTEWVEYTDLNTYSDIRYGSVEDTICMKCTCTAGVATDVLNRDCDSAYSYAAGTDTCPETSTTYQSCLNGDSVTKFKQDANDGAGLESIECSSEYHSHCGWSYDAIDGDYNWGCMTSVFCEIIAQENECIVVKVPSMGVGCDGELFEGWENYQKCCVGSTCNDEDINMEICVEDTELNAWYEEWFTCRYGDEYQAYFCSDTEDITCDYLESVGTWNFGCDCAAYSVFYTDASTETQAFFEEEMTVTMSQLDEWIDVLGCNLTFTCSLYNGRMSVNGITQEEGILWSHLSNYTCSDLVSAVDVLYDLSETECRSQCLSANFLCTGTVWYDYVKPTGKDVHRCYLFGQSCELIQDITKPVIASFWYYNISDYLECVNYPSNWFDNWFDDCYTYTRYSWCDYAYNSSTTAILSYQDTIYGLDALKVCCDCNGGLLHYNEMYLFEPKWKPTSKVNIYENEDDFICNSYDISSTVFNEMDILDRDKLSLAQFIGLCENVHSSLYDKYELLLSIKSENNDITDANDIYTDFMRFKAFDCANTFFLNNVTICNETDYNNLYPFIVDLEYNHIYVNNRYINIETFLYHLPPTKIEIKSFCAFSVLLETIYPTHPPTKEPTNEPTVDPTTDPTQDPTTEPTRPSLNPTSNPTTEPTINRRRLSHESDIYVRTNIMAAFLCDTTYTKEPTKYPTLSPHTVSPTMDLMSTMLSDTTKDIDGSESGNKGVSVALIVGSGGGGLCFFCLLIGGILYYFDKKASGYGSKGKDKGKGNDKDKDKELDFGFEMSSRDIQKPSERGGEKSKLKDKKKKFMSKSLAKWNNKDILEWIESISLREKWQETVVEAIVTRGCNGKDLYKLNAKKDVTDLLGIGNPMLCSRIWNEIKKLK